MSHMQVKQEMFVKYYAPLRDKLSAAHERLNQTGLVQLRSVLVSSKGTWITGLVQLRSVLVSSKGTCITGLVQLRSVLVSSKGT